MKLSAHEFGHVLGLGDAYDINRYNPTEEEYINSPEVPDNAIMYSHYPEDARPVINDIEMLIVGWVKTVDNTIIIMVSLE